MAWVDVGTDEPQWVEDTTGLTEIRDGVFADESGVLAEKKAAADKSALEARSFMAKDPSLWTDSQILWAMAYRDFDQAHRARFGVPIDRPWSVDAGAQQAKAAIDSAYQQLVADYAAQGYDVAVDPSLLGANAQPNLPVPRDHGKGGFGGLFSSLVDMGIGMIPGLAGAGLSTMAGLGPVGVGMFAGASQGAANVGDESPIKAIGKGALLGGIGGGVVDTVAPMFSDPLVGGGVAGAAAGGTTAALTGGDITEAAWRGGLAGVAKAPLTTGGDPTAELNADWEPGGYDVPASPAATSMTSDFFFNPATDTFMAEPLPPVQAMMYTPETAPQIDALMASQGVPGPTIEEFAALASPEMQGVLGGMLPGLTFSALTPTPDEAVLSAEADPIAATEADAAAPTEPAGTDAQTYVQTAAKLADWYLKFFGGEEGGSVPQFQLPPRTEGMTDEAYYEEVSEQVTEYLALDPQTIAELGLDIDLSPEALTEQGLVPGTPEYLQYLIGVADQVIQAIFGKNADLLLSGESIEGLQEQFRELTRKEAAQLLRALHVRGALGQITFASSVLDPFTGIMEDLGMFTQGIQGAPAAVQRGYAREIEDMMGRMPADAAEQLRTLLGRRTDLYGLQRAADARAERDRLLATLTPEQLEELRRRRVPGMLPTANIVSELDSRALRHLAARA